MFNYYKIYKYIIKYPHKLKKYNGFYQLSPFVLRKKNKPNFELTVFLCD